MDRVALLFGVFALIASAACGGSGDDESDADGSVDVATFL